MSLWTPDGVEAVYALCGWDPETRRLTIGQVEVPSEELRRLGYASELLDRVAAAHADVLLCQSPQSNLPAGESWLAAARRRGVAVHDYGCFRGNDKCVCVLTDDRDPRQAKP